MPGKGKRLEKWDSCFEQIKSTGKSEEAAAAICTAVEQKGGWVESVVLNQNDFENGTAAYESLSETAYLIFDKDTLVEVKKSAFGMSQKPSNEVKTEAPPVVDEEDEEEGDEEGVVPPEKKKRVSFEAVRANLTESFSGYELVDVYSDYAIVTTDKGTGDYKLYRAPFDEGRLNESVDEWEEIEITDVPDEFALDEPIEQPVPYKGEDVAEAFIQPDYEITDIYAGYVHTLKEGKKYRFDFTVKDGEILFSNSPQLVESPIIDYTGEQVVEAFKEAALPGELKDIYPNYIIAKNEEGYRERYNFINTVSGIIFESTPTLVQPIINVVRVIADKVNGLKESFNQKDPEITTNDKTRTLYISEALDLRESTVDRKNGIVDVTLIKPGWSLNGKYYSPQVLQQSVKVWDGIKAYGNHPTITEAKELPERSIWDQVGYYTQPRWEDNKVKATLKLVGNEDKKAHILDWAEESARTGMPLMGLSINAIGKTVMGSAEGRKGVIVENIAAGNSVDVVTTPSAGGSFDRLLASDDGFTNLLLQNLEYSEWKESRPDFLKRLRTEMKTARKDELETGVLQESEKLRGVLERKEGELTEAQERVNRAEEALDELRNEYESFKHTAFVDQKLNESKLPKDWVTSLRDKLLEGSREEVEATIREERQKYFGTKQPVTVKNAGAEPLEENYNSVVAEALGVGIVPLPFERPEEYEVRKNKIIAGQRPS